jgi:hypothetical protein
MCGVPDGHRLVQVAAEEVRADRAFELVNGREQLRRRSGPLQLAVAIGDIAIE